MAYTFSIAFYEKNSFVLLTEGLGVSGLVHNDTFDYYMIDLNQGGKDNTYEITVTPMSGDPDIAISLDA
jgi:hypothetical protein